MVTKRQQVGHKSADASWVGEGESQRTVVRRDRFEPKSMVNVFFKKQGVVHFGYVEKVTPLLVNTMREIV